MTGGSVVVGTISATGLYSAPASVPSGGAVTITAVSVADPSRSGSTTATITAPVSVSVSPSAPSVQANIGAQAFTATVSNTANTTVNWEVNGIAGGNATVGTISSIGVYLAPATVPSPATVTVTAASAADPARSGSATVTVTPPVSVSVTPRTASLQAHLGTQTFVPTVSNTANTAVTWQVNGVTGGNSTVGTISVGGVYSAPAVAPSPASVTVKAVSAADAAATASATVTVTPPVSVSVTPATAAVLVATGTQQYTATVSNATNTTVSWSVNGIVGGNTTVGFISGSGLYSAPATTPSPASVTIAAVSVQDPAASGTAQATVTASVTVSLSPHQASLTLQQTQQFTATVTGGGGVNWSVDGVSGGNGSVGTVSGSGLYTPPPSAGVHTVTATNAVNSADSASSTVAVTDLDGVFAYHNDLARTGQNLHEFALTPATVSGGSFGKRWSCALDGEVYAQPLYVANLSISGGVHNVVYVATMHDSLYAIDADDPGCVAYWKKSFLSVGVTTVPNGDTHCGDIADEIGVVGTPVIDPVSQTIYLVVLTKETAGYFQRLHAINISTGAETANSPAVISGSVSTSSGTLTFDPLVHNQRPGLALVNGGVYIAWASHCDLGAYHGWLMRYDATTLGRTAIMNVTPNGTEGGVWMSGAAPASDSTGSIYLTTGNGTFDDVNSIVPPLAPSNDFGQSFLRLDPTSLAVQDFYTPSQNAAWSNSDYDVGSSGVLLLPDGVGPLAHPNLMIGADKQGHIWVLDRTQLSHYSSTGENVVQYLTGPGASVCLSSAQCALSAPAYWNGTVYVGFTKNPVSAFKLTSGLLTASGANAVAASQTADTYRFPGPTPMISASSASANGVVWVLDNSNNGTEGSTSAAAILRAYSAADLGTRLYSSDSAALGADAAGNGIKFTLPVIANGHVYVANSKQLTVYGLAP